MYPAFLLTTFFLFGAVVDSPTSPTAAGESNMGIAPPTTTNPLTGAPPSTTAQPGSGGSSLLRQRDMLRMKYKNTVAGRRQMAESEMYILPQPPTVNTDNVGSQIYQWLPPTVNPGSGSGNRSTSTSGTMGGLSLIPNSPTRARPDVPQSYASRQAAQSLARQSNALRNSGPSNTPITRPYSGYSRPSGGTSPYMRLYNRSSLGVDNYTTWVQPELQQQQLNRTYSNDIHHLQSSSRVQGFSLRRLGQETNSLRGVNATQYYMNYGDYYQGAR